MCPLVLTRKLCVLTHLNYLSLLVLDIPLHIYDTLLDLAQNSF